MDEKARAEQMKEYLRLKELQENDQSDEMIEDIYSSILNESENTAETSGEQ